MWYRIIIVVIIVLLILIFAAYMYIEWATGKNVGRSIANARIQGAPAFQQSTLAKAFKQETDVSGIPPAWVIDAYKPTKFWFLYYKTALAM